MPQKISTIHSKGELFAWSKGTGRLSIGLITFPIFLLFIDGILLHHQIFIVFYQPLQVLVAKFRQNCLKKIHLSRNHMANLKQFLQIK